MEIFKQFFFGNPELYCQHISNDPTTDVKKMFFFFLTARRLNEYIRHYEPLTYDAQEVHRNHLRSKRSATTEQSSGLVTLRFRAHGRDFRLRLKRDLQTFSTDLTVVGPGDQPLDLDASHIYQGHLLGESCTLFSRIL